jgi:hypothetical protein
MVDQFSVHLTSLLDFANELQTQIEGIAAPMDGLAAQSGVQPRYGAFTEAWMLAESQQAALEEMYSLLGQVREAITFSEDVTKTVASGYQQADQDVAAGLGYGAPGATPVTATPAAANSSSAVSIATPIATPAFATPGAATSAAATGYAGAGYQNPGYQPSSTPPASVSTAWTPAAWTPPPSSTSDVASPPPGGRSYGGAPQGG